MRGIRSLVILLVLLGGLGGFAGEERLPEPSARGLPRWRGFNLLEMFQRDWGNEPFRERDFQWISEWGFNFVRIPMDYRIWIKGGDWERFDEGALQRVDRAVAYGRKYGIHVCLNFHRAPGYTVANPPEATSLWEDAETQRVCALHWATFARRFRGVPNRNLSFNLLNEPSHVDREKHAQVIRLLVSAIRAEDPNRLIIIDGLDYAQHPCEELVPLGIAQATRGYRPSQLTHYRASWVTGSDEWALPMWPQPLGCAGYLYGSNKAEMRSPLVIEASLTEPFIFYMRVGTVSYASNLQMWVDGRHQWEQSFHPGPEEGPWKEVVYRPEWGIYQNIYDRVYEVSVPSCNKAIQLTNTLGDWMTLTELGFRFPDGRVFSLPVNPRWGDTHAGISFDPNDTNGAFQSDRSVDGQSLWDNHVSIWADFKETPVGVMVGEWGSYNKTPHDVTLRWMEDCLQNFQTAGLGWALWNFRGSFGILDSGRADVEYENYRRHKLDRDMLELLQRY